jgi:osmoprotectant transport system ATP-binding protein
MLIFESVVKHYGRQHALGPLSLRVQQATTVAVTGPPGAGKTTLLRLALGLTSPEAGIVIVGGVAVTRAHVAAARRRIGYVPQGGLLFPHLTVAQNITLATRPARWSQDRCAKRVAELCNMFRFPPSNLGRYPPHLSEGERRRVAFLRALVLDPELLVIDDPFIGLDPMVRYALRTEIVPLLQSLGKATLFASASLADCAAFSRDIALLRAGSIAQRSSAEELAANPASLFVSEFVKAQRGAIDV